MSTSSAAINFDSSMPRPYSDSWREAYGQNADTPRFSSYQAPNGNPVIFVFDSIGLGGGQNVDTAEYPYGFWSNTWLGEKPHTIKVKGHLIGEDYIKERNELVTALQVATDDDSPATLDLPLWGRFKVVVQTWDVDEEKNETGSCGLSIDFVRAGYSDTQRFAAATSSLTSLNVEKAVDDLKTAATKSFTEAVNAAKDADTLASGFGQIINALSSVVGRVQGAVSVINGVMNKINAVTNLIAQGVRSPKELCQALVSAAFGIVAAVLEIKNAADETASYFMTGDDDDDSVSEQFVKRNEKNVMMNFLTAASYELTDEAITEQQYNTKKAVENLYRTVSFGVASQLLTQLDPDSQTYESQQGLWALLEKLEESIDKEEPDVYAAVEEVRIATAETLLSQNYDMELTRKIKKEMPLLSLALYLGCDADRIRTLNSVSDSFLIKGDVIYV